MIIDYGAHKGSTESVAQRVARENRIADEARKRTEDASDKSFEKFVNDRILGQEPKKRTGANEFNIGEPSAQPSNKVFG